MIERSAPAATVMVRFPSGEMRAVAAREQRLPIYEIQQEAPVDQVDYIEPQPDEEWIFGYSFGGWFAVPRDNRRECL